jgi:uncharacterized protein (TIGR03437 family)
MFINNFSILKEPYGRKSFGSLSLLLSILVIFFGCSGRGLISDDKMAAAAMPADQPSAEALQTGLPELPRTYVNTAITPGAGRTINLAAGGDLNAALKSAQPGDTIVLQAGAIYRGGVVLPNKPGDGWITIRTSTPDSRLPKAGVRVTPAEAPLLARIQTENSEPAIQAAKGAHHYRLIGLEITMAPNNSFCYELVALGPQSMKSPADYPHELILERLYIHATSAQSVRRGVALNSGSTAIIDSWIDEIHEEGADSAAIGGWGGSGPFKIVNNHLESAGINFFQGGAVPSITNATPSDIEIRRNHIYKSLKWKEDDPSFAGKTWTVKNLLELKIARRVLIDGNVFEHNWLMGQIGFAILLTVRVEDDRVPWSVVNDVTITNNIIRGATGGIEMAGFDGKEGRGESRRILIKNNLFEDIDGPRWRGNDNGGGFLKMGGISDVTVSHNTVLNSGSITIAHTAPSMNFTFSDNLIAHNDYGVKGDGEESGTSTLSKYYPGCIFRKNVVAGANPKVYPGDNFYPERLEMVKFVDAKAHNYRLAADSPYRQKATDGKDIGVDFDALSDRSLVTSVSAASYLPGRLAPELISAVFGSRLATKTLVASSLPLPTTLGGTSVRIRDANGIDRDAPLFFVSTSQINFLIPAATAYGSAEINVHSDGGLASQSEVEIAPVAPAFFSFDASGRGLPAGYVVRSIGKGIQQQEPLARFDQTLKRWTPQPIIFGSADEQLILVLFGTGFRRRLTTASVTLKAGEADCAIVYAGPQGSLIGLDQINAVLPPSLAGRGEIELTMNVDGQSAVPMRLSVK